LRPARGPRGHTWRRRGITAVRLASRRKTKPASPSSMEGGGCTPRRHVLTGNLAGRSYVPWDLRLPQLPRPCLRLPRLARGRHGHARGRRRCELGARARGRVGPGSGVRREVRLGWGCRGQCGRRPCPAGRARAEGVGTGLARRRRKIRKKREQFIFPLQWWVISTGSTKLEFLEHPYAAWIWKLDLCFWQI